MKTEQIDLLESVVRQRKNAVKILRQIADELEQQMAEQEKKVVPFRTVKRKPARRQVRIAA